jgi:hypothetical protein
LSVMAAAPAGLSKQRICQALGQPRHRCYPDRRRRKATAPARAPARRLTAEQDQAVLAALPYVSTCDPTATLVFYL